MAGFQGVLAVGLSRPQSSNCAATAASRQPLVRRSSPSPRRSNASFGGPSRPGGGNARSWPCPRWPPHRLRGARHNRYQIWLRPVPTLEATPIQGTDGGFPSGRLTAVPSGSSRMASSRGFDCRRTSDRAGRRTGRERRELEPRQCDSVRPGPPKTACARVSAAGIPTVATTLDKTAGEGRPPVASLSARWPPLSSTPPSPALLSCITAVGDQNCLAR